ncbi:MarR family winged helix-turn-helix transcriptional regulator [Dethiosulfatarculus sandiegensis]|uniref:MarR family transcriptional regulator n=1 Tax=Dethiosulfatarculus sandiegensis TaxID=1429043 RepID=A0A0D2JAA0_9BACT|nr:MarR family transcriptional regulator [Dethiosulfatarculus sandiegensis]KIX15064.1 MarR family transcriptional regulator [Dethiosulfatarculus sandiegensis]
MHKIVKNYLSLFEKISNMSRQSKSFDTDVKIYRSEIHVIQFIGDNTELYVSEISKLIGVTKGTVSQIVKRLESKGLVRKKTDEANNTRQLVRLTEKGKTAYAAHNRYHLEQNIEMENYLKTLDADQLALLEEFIHRAGEMIEDHI